MSTLLLIEGHSRMRSAVKDLLLHEGIDSILEISDPILAVDVLKRNTPSIIILDCTWAEVNGLWLTRLVHELAPQGKILLLLDDMRQDYQDAAQSSGADACIAKNVLQDQLPCLLSKWQTELSRPPE